MSVDCLVTNSSTSKRFLHKVQYERIKEECPSLPTGLVQCARDVAVEAVKAWNAKRTKLKRKHPKKAERMRRPSMKEKCTMRYDVRTVTMRGSQLTFSTCGKRIRTIISIPKFFTGRYSPSEGWKLKGANIGMDRKGRVFVNLIYECPDPEIENNDGKIVGLVMCALSCRRKALAVRRGGLKPSPAARRGLFRTRITAFPRSLPIVMGMYPYTSLRICHP